MALSKKIKRAGIVIAGIFFIILGVIGLFLPVLQGFLFIAIGLVLLSFHSVTIQGLLDRHGKRYPKFHALMVKARTWIARIIGDLP